MSKNIGVITGDIVKSRSVDNKRKYINILKDLFAEVQKVNKKIPDYIIFRGDSFQILLSKPSDAAYIAVVLRAGLKIKFHKSLLRMRNRKRDSEDKVIMDMRIAAGIGKVEFIAKNISESNGEAFLLSGLELDKMSGTNDRIRIITSDTEINDELTILNKLADAIISKWSLYSAEIAYMHLLYNFNQSEIGKKLKISQSAVNQRFAASNIEVIKSYINRAGYIIKNKYE